MGTHVRYTVPCGTVRNVHLWETGHILCIRKEVDLHRLTYTVIPFLSNKDSVCIRGGVSVCLYPPPQVNGAKHTPCAGGFTVRAVGGISRGEHRLLLFFFITVMSAVVTN